MFNVFSRRPRMCFLINAMGLLFTQGNHRDVSSTIKQVLQQGRGFHFVA
jgi:hypothetical protein